MHDSGVGGQVLEDGDEAWEEGGRLEDFPHVPSHSLVFQSLPPVVMSRFRIENESVKRKRKKSSRDNTRYQPTPIKLRPLWLEACDLHASMPLRSFNRV